jgi:hypothetical protein
MIFELRTYTITPGQMPAYLRLVADVGIPIITRYADLVGYWRSEVGELNQVLHLWRYESLDDRAARRAALYEDPEWTETFLPRAWPYVQRQHSTVLLPTGFSPLQ